MDDNKIRLVSLLASYHLSSIMDFPTRVSNTSATAVDNIFINKNINTTFSITPPHNGLSDHLFNFIYLFIYLFTFHRSIQFPSGMDKK
jgi:hypothetical protein